MRPAGRMFDMPDLHEVDCEGMGWINLAQDSDNCRTLLNAVMKLRVP
jgi:hypothetical protein